MNEIAFIISNGLVGLFGFHIFSLNKGIHNDPSNCYYMILIPPYMFS